ncbi:MAG: hypothetical protein WB919_17240 [Candidatus Sulfotelmatobacter sp.]
MSVRSGFVLLLSLSTLLFLAACGNGTGAANAVAPPTGSFSASSLNGTYVFSVSGVDSEEGAPYSIAGTITANGSGTITGGTFDLNDADANVTSGPIANASINSNGSYSVSVDGRGQATIGSPSISGGNLTFDFVLQDSSHGLITEFDAFGTGSGTLDLQTSGVTPTGSYAFSLSGASYSGTSWATVGNFTLSGTALSGFDDFDEGLLAYADSTLAGSLVLNSSSGPATTLDVTSSSSSAVFSGTFDAFAIDASHVKLIEMDTTATLAGDAYTQTSPTISAETLAFTLSGSEFAAGGYMVTNGSGGITGTEDYNVEGTNISSQSSPAPFTASYAVDASDSGRYVLNSFATFEGGTSYAAYPSSGGILLLENDGDGISLGAAYAQTAGATFAASQGYGINLTGTYLGANTDGQIEEVDDIAEITAASGGTATGIIDENFDPDGGPTLGIPLSGGQYGAIGSTGRFGLSATAGTTTLSTLEGGFNLSLYSVDGITFPFVELDSGQVSTGVIVLQSPSSSSAGVAKPHNMFVVPPLIHAHMARQKKQ